MEITGRITKDAEIRTTKSGKELVGFTIAINDSYKPKDGELKIITTYIRCSYWRSTKAIVLLRKAALVQLSGRIGMDVYNNLQGDAVGALTFNVGEIKVLAFPRKKEGDENSHVAAGSTGGFTGKPTGNTRTTPDDLPF